MFIVNVDDERSPYDVKGHEMKSNARMNQNSKKNWQEFVAEYLLFMVKYIRFLDSQELCRIDRNILEQNIALSFKLLSDAHMVKSSPKKNKDNYDLDGPRQQIPEHLNEIQQLLQSYFHDSCCLDTCIDALLHLQQCYPLMFKAKCSSKPWVARRKFVYQKKEQSD